LPHHQQRNPNPRLRFEPNNLKTFPYPRRPIRGAVEKPSVG